MAGRLAFFFKTIRITMSVVTNVATVHVTEFVLETWHARIDLGQLTLPP